MPLANDARGWILTCVSGVACTVGAAIICVDLLIQKLPGQGDFRIQDSNGFLAGALSLSFGVMLFSALNTMLPEAQEYLRKGGLTDRPAAWVNIACFLGGVVGIQIFSRILHHFIPSNVVDCDHTHENETHDHKEHDDNENHHPHQHHARPKDGDDERTPLMSRSRSAFESSHQEPQVSNAMPMRNPSSRSANMKQTARPILQQRFTSRMVTFMAGSKSSCDEGGPCYGYSDPCGLECFKVADRIPTRLFGRPHPSVARHPALTRSTTTSQIRSSAHAIHGNRRISDTTEGTLGLRQDLQDHRPKVLSYMSDHGRQIDNEGLLDPPGEHTSDHPEYLDLERGEDDASISGSSTANEALHHHHVPENAFYSIGLQTSMAIALHKLPEGFITYATNHANPELGFSVFMALFIHNFTEGFAMALPMYLALKNRFRAMVISSVLGGISQPFGAAIAALWFQLAGSGEKGPGETVYGCMFSITAGIMASVALQLFSESLTLTHNRHICTIFAFVGMAILQISHALTA